MVTPSLEYLIQTDAPAHMTPEQARELSAQFNKPNPWGRVQSHPDIESGVGYHVGAVINTTEHADAYGAFWSVTWRMAYDAGELRGGMTAQRPPRLGPDVLSLHVTTPMPYTTPLGEQSVFKRPLQHELVGTLRPHALGVQFHRFHFALVLQFEISAGDLRALHRHLGKRNADFGF